MRVPVYAHKFASVPAQWLDLPDFLAETYNPDPSENGGHVIPGWVVDGFTAPLLHVNPYRGWMQFAPSVKWTRRLRFRMWRVDWADRIERAWDHLRGRSCD